MLRATLLLACLAAALPASAQELLDEYFAHIETEDMRSSKGVVLRGLGAVLQQDRANYHRFGIRHQHDTGDRYFGDRAMRARLPDLYRAGGGDADIERVVFRQGAYYIHVRVYGRNGVPTYVTVAPGAG